MLVSDKYKNLNERMIGDIDILIRANDTNGVKQVFNDLDYHQDDTDYLINHRHINRFVNKNEICAIEPHIRLLSRKNQMIDENSFFRDKTYYNNLWIPSSQHLLLHNILNHQLNDFGFRRKIINLKNSYDTYLLLNDLIFKNLNASKYNIIGEYFYKLEKLKIHKIEKILNKNNFFYEEKFIYKNKLMILFNFYFFNFILKLKKSVIKFLEFFKNKDFRVHVFKKILRKFAWFYSDNLL